ncbi:hypothetical protein [Oricola sp.]|uniref:hypothetical protein n=1 Tax=Oricola sp. TaxID=1979950 RepID=UPI003BAD87D4
MGSQIIEYSYSGDEAAWRQSIESFHDNIAADAVLREGFTYQVFVREDGATRVHVPVWRDPSVLEHLRAQPFFKEFAAQVKDFAGGEITYTKPVLETTP